MISEIILENFMSYRYGRIPLKPGINVICGPNGAGKSSILLAISVALGQTHTERSRKLSGLIRRGEDIARVTLVFRNKVNGKKLFRGYDSNNVTLTRYIRRDGKYWFELQGEHVPKSEVQRLLSSIALNPDNLLIIMHQGMIGEFLSFSPSEKLRYVEEALGIRKLRENILAAYGRLQRIAERERQILASMKSIENVYNYWKTQCERLHKKRKLILRRKFLEREYAWARYYALDEELKKLENRLRELSKRIEKDIEYLKEISPAIEEYRSKVFEMIIGKTSSGDILPILEKLLRLCEQRGELRAEVRLLEDVKSELVSRIDALKPKVDALYKAATFRGEPIKTGREPSEIRDELKVIDGYLKALKDVPANADKMYEAYSKTYSKLRDKLREVLDSKSKMIDRVQVRSEKWRSILEEYVRDVNEKFKEILASVGAVGEVKLVNLDDIENAGLKIYVGFHGSAPAELDTYTQSGGERSVAVIAFLIALQQFVKSPFRAIDEYDVHMDPSNKERIEKAIYESIRASGVQYLLITPSPAPFMVEKDTNVIIVQKVSGESVARILRK